MVAVCRPRRCPGIDLPLLCVITHSRSLVCHYPIPIIGDWIRIFIQRRSLQRVCDRSRVHCPDSSPGTAGSGPPPNGASSERLRAASTHDRHASIYVEYLLAWMVAVRKPRRTLPVLRYRQVGKVKGQARLHVVGPVSRHVCDRAPPESAGRPELAITVS